MTKKTLFFVFLIAHCIASLCYSIPVSDGFDYPVGSTGYATQSSDGDGWYNAQDYLNYYSGYGYHLGEDWNGEGGGNTDLGQPVYASSNGTVVYRGNGGTGWGNVIIIRHQLSSGTLVETLYAHLNSMSVNNGQDVNRRSQIGTIGDAGGLYSAHLHYELRYSNCTSWGSPGSGYSSTSSPTGWTDPSNFINNNRPSVISLSQYLGIYATRTNPATIYSLPNEYSGTIPAGDINTYYRYTIANTGTTGVTLEDTGVNYYNASGFLFRVPLGQSVYLAPGGGSSYREQRVYITDQHTSNQTTTFTGKVAYKISGVWYELSGAGSSASFTVYPRPSLSSGMLIKSPSSSDIYYYQQGYKWRIDSENDASLLSSNWNTEYFVFPNSAVSSQLDPLTPSINSTVPMFVGRNLIYKQTGNANCYLIDSDPSYGGSLRSRRFQGEPAYYNYGYAAGTLASQSVAVSSNAYNSIMSEYPLGSEIGNNLSVNPSSINVGYQAGSSSFSVTSNISWTASDNISWAYVSPSSSSGNASVTVYYEANPLTTSRTGTITVSGSGLTQTVTV
ncbi:MAG: peptidoglycan DD-metalloendopeptidase family protein, partial [Candidatus Cloacimonadota bacterium]